MINKQKVPEHGYQYYINEAAETIARIEAEKIDDIQILLQYLETSAANGEENICMIYLQKMFQAVKFSSDYIDIAKILQKHTGLQDYFSIPECMDRAKKLAKVPRDWLEIKHFTDSSLPLYERKDNFNKKRGEK